MSSTAELFDQGQFQAELALKSSPIAAFKKAIKQACTILDQRFCTGYDIRKLITERAWFIDQILIQAWKQFNWSEPNRIALLAVGGYGRGELHPHSDIDVLILIENGYQEQFTSSIEKFLMLLWDIGLEIGHSVRTLDECAEHARNDLTIITNLIECRTITGADTLRKQMLAATSTEHMWPSSEFLIQKYYEQKARHEKYNDTEYNLEPNVKGSPGGLRDIQTILWIGRREYGKLKLHAMIAKGFITENEYRVMNASLLFLWKVRYALHMLANRAEDRLLFDYQAKVANLLGYTAEEPKVAIEQLMKKYYRMVMNVSSINEIIYQHFKEVILEKNKTPTITPLNKHFQICNDFIEVTQPDVFKKEPSALLEIFLVLAKHPDIWGIRANTIRLLCEARYLINDKFRHDPKNSKLFLDLFKCETDIHRNLRRMNRYGILGRYIPAFGHIVGQMQYDLFHIYTVDAHTLNVIKHLRKLSRSEMIEKFPLPSKVFLKLAKPELIYLAGLFHDIGKGRGGDHSEIGAEEVVNFGKLHRLPAEDTKLIAWLVANHLIMSTTAQRKDLTDPKVINDFALRVGDENHLNYLYVLTVADINATNPTLWNSWRATLLQQLYTETKRALRRGLTNLLGRNEQIHQTQQAAMDILIRSGVDEDEIMSLWTQMGEDYFLRHTSSDIAWHTEAILHHANNQDPLVLFKQTSQRGMASASQIFIYAPKQWDFFAVTVSIMGQLNLSIQDARILPSTSKFSLDTYIVLNEDGSSIGQDQHRIDTIRKELINGLKNPENYQTIIQRRVPRQLKHFTFKPRVSIYNDLQNDVSVVQIEAPDRPGLLARIAKIFLSYDLTIQGAKITTLGERVEDNFLVIDKTGHAISNTELIAQLQQTIINKLSEISQPTSDNLTIAI
ncbi:[protein-PII] uridylyltransferase [Entomomonas asaccharolytica]|uniref:Bifunctional uridylyltransferase/uridylyl-removing enzyme n=1 Tax=Entomomonas asaccharolytica TaxID=2785331 RepID=A0A974RVQ7_9GAMM|nr:[protein-PII] uridylyltransferase [Entomomonas asaccharolytica]QQP84393.1 [protein-PII] uridylyltransferase [Entomomonas asaccharolytica]